MKKQFPTFEVWTKFQTGDEITIQGERGRFTVMYFREDTGGTVVFVSSNGNGCRVFDVDRMKSLSKRERQTLAVKS
jgi:hypothetical protein